MFHIFSAVTKGDRGTPTSILHTKIKLLEMMTKEAVDAIESRIKKLEEVHKKSLDAYSSTDGSYPESKDQLTGKINSSGISLFWRAYSLTDICSKIFRNN